MLDEPAHYTKQHFATGEHLMRLHNDPPYGEHKKVHDQFTGSVLKPQTRFKSGTIGLTTNVFNFLKGWLINHIKGTDKQYSPYLRSRGVA